MISSSRFPRVDPVSLVGKSYRRSYPDDNALICIIAVSPNRPKTHVVVECEGERWEVEANAVQAALEGQGDGQEINARSTVLAADAAFVTVAISRQGAEPLREVLLFVDNELANRTFPDWEDRGIHAGVMETAADLLAELNRVLGGATPPAA